MKIDSNVSIRLKGDVDLIKMDDALLINAGTSKFTKMSGEYANLVKRILETIKKGIKIKDLFQTFKDELDEMDLQEILEALDTHQLLLKSNVGYGLSKVEQKRYMQQINYFNGYFSADAAEDYIKQLKALNIFVYGAELLASRIIQSLTLMGIGSISVLTNFNEVVEDEIYNTFFYKEEDIGKNKIEIIKKRCQEINPHVKFNGYYEKEDLEVLKNADLVILAYDIQNYSAYEEINKFLVKNNVTSLLCGFLRDEIFFGPTIVPGETACFSCYDKRCRGNKSFFQEYIAYMDFLKQKNYIGNALSVRLDLISSYVTNEVLMLLPYLKKNITQLMNKRLGVMTIEDAVSLNTIFRYGRPTTWSNQVTIEFYPQYRATNNPVLRLPRCEVCGSTADKSPMISPWSLPLE